MAIRVASLGATLVESGLCNQLWTLAGLVLIARATNSTLCLPPFAQYVHASARTRTGRFDDIVQAIPVIDALAAHGIRARATCEGVPFTKHDGWHEYKKHFAADRVRTGGRSVHQPIVDALFDALHPSPRLFPSIRAAHATIGCTPYDCVHARVEPDIRHVTRQPPQWTDFVRAWRALPADVTSRVYVASGAELPSDAPSSWRQRTRASVALDASGVDNFTYDELSAIDYFVCADAARLVGHEASSFSRTLAVRFLKRRRPVVFACSKHAPVELRNLTRMYTYWRMCPSPHPYRFGSFGYV
jgi:hypothetical protein